MIPSPPCVADPGDCGAQALAAVWALPPDRTAQWEPGDYRVIVTLKTALEHALKAIELAPDQPELRLAQLRQTGE